MNFIKGYFPLNRAINQVRGVNALHLHWINELIAPILWSKGWVRQTSKIILFAVDVLVVRLRGVSVTWTIHNLVAHETKNGKLELRVRRVLARVCTCAIVHSKHALQQVESVYGVTISRKSKIIPHGNYEGCYPFSEERRADFVQSMALDEKSVVVLFFGALRPYKGVRRLVEIFKRVDGESLRLVVAGRPLNKDYLDEITRLANPDSRIFMLSDFIPSDSVAALFSICDVVALPFERTLTSGSAVLALTMGRPLLLPEDARVLDVVNESCALFYGSDEDLMCKLAALDKESLGRMGKVSRALSDSRSWDRVAMLTESAYFQR